MILLWIKKTASCSLLGPIFLSILFSTPEEITQFILNPLSNKKVQAIAQDGPEPQLQMIFYLTRTYAYYLSKEKENMGQLSGPVRGGVGGGVKD